MFRDRFYFFLVCAPKHCLISNLSVTDGQQWEFMETRANRSGTGFLMVRYKKLILIYCQLIYFSFIQILIQDTLLQPLFIYG